MATRKPPVIFAAVAVVLAATLCAALARRLWKSTAPPPEGPIQHVVVIMQENRSFDHLFNGFPGADTVQSGMNHGVRVPLVPTPLGNGPDADHTHTGWWQQWDNGK